MASSCYYIYFSIKIPFCLNEPFFIRILKGLGYDCDVVANGLEVLSSLKRQHYDMVFMDIQMPEMDGLQATRKIIALYGKKRPFIFHSIGS